jgi:methylenetetrahydrofolate reductase (NADPH)
MNANSFDEDLKFLKDKCDAGADFIVTQLFYDVELYLVWVEKCRALGIKIPIIPGIMPIQNYNGFKRMTGFCKTAVPRAIEEALELIKNDDAQVKNYGIELGISMCRRLLAAGTPGLHFYTLNLERSVQQILEGLGYVTPKQIGRLPWKQSQIARRQKEDVRPIFWANRPKTYLERTGHWDDFPNGRWGPRESPAFGDLADHHLLGFRVGTEAERRKLWGESIEKPIDVFTVFAKYIDGEVSRLPWCENSLQLETVPLKNVLREINQFGILTINSQPKVNGVASSDPAVGWGGAGGYVYQKAYLEFFTSEQHLEKLVKLAAEYPSITYTAVDIRGKTVTNLTLSSPTVNAVTWGVFPNKEIVQPTIVDVDSFRAWKDEAFALWIQQWGKIYPDNSESAEVIQEIHDTYFLVNVVDNDYVNGDMFAFFQKLLL